MTMQEFTTAINKAAEIYNGEIISMRNDLEGNLHVLLTQRNFDKLEVGITNAYPCMHPANRGDFGIEKQVDNIIFTTYRHEVAS